MWQKVTFLVIVLAVHNLDAIVQLNIEPALAFEGDSILMQCHIFPTKVPPLEGVTWKHNSNVINSTDPLSTSNKFHINQVRLDDAGTYTCSNDLAESTTSLIVIKPTRIVNLMSAYEVTPGNNITTNCEVDADSRLEFHTKWFYGEAAENPIENDDRFVIANDSLTISNVSASEIGDYTCEASTVVDKIRSTIKITLDEVPNAPILKEKSFKCNDSSLAAEISWAPTENYGPEIENFTIVTTSKSSSEANNVKTTEEDVAADSRSIVIWPLKPWTQYRFRVSAKNKIGASAVSEPSPICLTKPNFPYKNPENIKVFGTLPTNLIISWTPMPPAEHNGPDFHYRVSWKRNINTKQWITKEFSDWQQGNITISDQPTFVQYLAKVEAINSVGKSNATADEYLGSSGEGVPSQAPLNVRPINVKSTSAILQWDPVPIENINGFYKGYIVRIWNETDGENNFTEIIGNSSVPTNHTRLTALRPATRNFVQVCIFNSQYQGSFSDVVEFDTLEDVPSIVQSFKVSPLNSTAFSLQWDEPEHSNGILTGYNIYNEQINGTANSTFATELPLITANPNETAIEVNNLKPKTNYRVSITATTAAGESERVSIESETSSSSSTSANVMLINALLAFILMTTLTTARSSFKSQ